MGGLDVNKFLTQQDFLCSEYAGRIRLSEMS